MGKARRPLTGRKMSSSVYGLVNKKANPHSNSNQNSNNVTTKSKAEPENNISTGNINPKEFDYNLALQQVTDLMADLERATSTKAHDELSAELSRLDTTQSDILHLIENTNFSASEGYIYAKMLKEVREKRRNIKNKMTCLADTRRVVTKYSGDFKGILVNRKETRLSRYYTFRYLPGYQGKVINPEGKVITFNDYQKELKNNK